jgi:hypothetical protein
VAAGATWGEEDEERMAETDATMPVSMSVARNHRTRRRTAPWRAREAPDLGLVDCGEGEVGGHSGDGGGNGGGDDTLSAVLVGRLRRPLLPAAGASPAPLLPAPSAFIDAARGERHASRIDAVDVLDEHLVVPPDLPRRLPLSELRNPLPPSFLIVGGPPALATRMPYITMETMASTWRTPGFVASSFHAPPPPSATESPFMTSSLGVVG